MQEPDQHVSPIKSPRQLVIVVALAFIVPIALIVLLSQLVTGVPHGRNEDDRRVLSRIQAFGNVVMADASGPKGNLSGETVYGQVCKTCHDIDGSGLMTPNRHDIARIDVLDPGDAVATDRVLRAKRARPDYLALRRFFPP